MKGRLLWFLRGESGVAAIAQTVVANAGIQAVNIVSGVLAARTLGPAGRGSLTAITMWPQFLAYALTFGVPIAFVYNIKRRPELQSALTGAAILLSLVFGALASVVGFLVIPYSLRTYPADTIHTALWAVLVAPLALCGIMLSVQVQSADSFKHYNFFRFLPQISVLAVLVAERLSGTLTVTHASLAYLLAGTPAMFWNLAWVNRRFRPTYTSLLATAKILLGYGLRAWGADLFSMVANQVDRILVVSLLPPEAMGLYVVAQSAAGVLNTIPNAVVPVTLPKAAGCTAQEIVALAGRSVRMTLFVLIVAGLPLFFGGTLLLKIFYGAKFLGASIVLRLLVIETILDGLTAVLSQAFLAAGFPGTVTFLEGCGVLTAIPLLYWLIPRYGVNGAALGLVLSTATRFVFILVNFPIRLKISAPGLIISRQELKEILQTRMIARSTEV